MRTYILFWNPEISSFKLDDFQEKLGMIEYLDLNWSVWEHEEACSGDRFFMVRCGEGKTGICMSGYFASDPYKGKDWSGKGREVYYMDLEPDTMIHPDYRPILTTDELTKAIPDFDWTGGHSGRLLDAGLAEKLEAIWKKFLEDNEEMFKTRTAQQEVDLDLYPSIKDPVQEVYLELTYEGKIRGEIRPFAIEAEGNDIESVKKQIAEQVFQKTGKKPKIHTRFGYIPQKDQALYRKTVEYVLEKKKGNMTFRGPYYEVDASVVCLLNKVNATTKGLKEKKFPDRIIKAVDALRQRPKERYAYYAERAAKNPIAKEIIRTFVYEALNITYLEKIDEDSMKFLNEYLAAWHILNQKEQD